MQNLKKLLEPIQNYGDGPFLGQNGPFAPNKNFLGKSLILFLSTYWPISLCQILIFFTIDPELWGFVDFRTKMGQFDQSKIFLGPVNKPSSYHSCLSTFQKSKSDINLLMKYWWLKNTEILLAKGHFWL